MAERENQFEWNQFCKLGEMIGDGLHYEEPWISKEYTRLQKILLSETQEEKDYKKKVRKEKNKNINNQVKEKLKTDKCECGSELEQTRSGSKRVKCTSSTCEKTYTYRYKK